MNVLINAYAISPTWGSEPGMGWNWVSNLARYCKLYIITEGEWKGAIEKALAGHPYKENLNFYYLPVPEEVRVMCWNQGDWRFYWYYHKWQKRALAQAKEILASVEIDVIHQLNMIGYREPGLLWKISGYKFIWGPIGGMETMPISYIKGSGCKTILFNCLKNLINSLQYRFSPNVRQAVKKAEIVIAATKGCQEKLEKYYHRKVYLMNETGCDVLDTINKSSFLSKKMSILWVGKFDFRKQLDLAIKVIHELKDLNVQLRVVGSGDQSRYQDLAKKLSIDDKVIFLGKVDHDKINHLMQESDVFLFTSIMEATSTVVMEALQNHLPVVCFDTCGFGTVVDESVGVKVSLSNPNNSVSDFAKVIRGLYFDRARLCLLSENCEDKVKQFDWKFKAQSLVELYS